MQLPALFVQAFTRKVCSQLFFIEAPEALVTRLTMFTVGVQRRLLARLNAKFQRLREGFSILNF